MMQQQMAMQQQQQQQGQQQKAAAPAKPEVRLMANIRLNCILANAPPDEMRVIKEAILTIDVPLVDRSGLGEGSRAAQKYQTYHLATLDPEVMVSLLETVGDLGPQTKLEVDKKNRAVIAYASIRDQKTIGTLVKNLDGSDRTLEVIQLRKLDAIDVAGTLRLRCWCRRRRPPRITIAGVGVIGSMETTRTTTKRPPASFASKLTARITA